MTRKIDADKFEHWLNRRWKSSVKCPVCDSYDWNYGDRLFELHEYLSDRVVRGDVDVYPLIAVTCNTCGYTRLFNAVVAGLA